MTSTSADAGTQQAASLPQGSASDRVLADLLAIAERIQTHITALVDRHIDQWTSAGGDPNARGVLAAYREMALSGGKRLRPAFTFWAYQGAGGDPADQQALDAALAVELLHTFALIHDDVMDRAATRRSVETIHVAHARRHAELGYRGDADHYGDSIAILMGDLAFAHASELVVGLPKECSSIFFTMCADLMVGQYLDIESAARGISAEVSVAPQITELKTARYTVECPLVMGAALAGRADDLAEPLRAYGNPVGHAFQLRDDLLGAFGDPSTTGKPVGDDIAQGKVTRLLELALDRSEGEDREVILRLGGPEMVDSDVDRARELLEATGARAEVEATIARLVEEGVAALDGADLTIEAKDLLSGAAILIANRNH